MLLITDLRSPQRGRDAFLARLLAPSLDRKLAAGCSPESHRLLGIRANALVAPATRRSLSRSLEKVLKDVRGSRRAGSRRAPLCRDRIIAAESDLREIISYLSVPLPLAPRGVALVTSLLRDGTGPLYNADCRSDLRSAIRQAIATLDPLP